MDTTTAPTARDLAESLGVTRATVYRALARAGIEPTGRTVHGSATYGPEALAALVARHTGADAPDKPGPKRRGRNDR